MICVLTSSHFRSALFNTASSAAPQMQCNCVRACWDGAQDCCNFGIWQSDAVTVLSKCVLDLDDCG
jgi:hypothetical protein